MACRQQDCLILSPYQMALLQQGTRCHGEFDEVENPGVLLSMEYALSVGTMIIDEVAHVNEHMLRAVVEVRNSISSNDMDYTLLEVHFNDEVCKRREVEATVKVLKEDVQNLRDEVQNLQGLFNNILFRLADVEEEARGFHLFNVAHQHGPTNPIVVDENDETVADSEDKCQHLAGEADDDVEILEEGEVRGGAVFLTGGILVLIEDVEEDPRDASRLIDWAEERAELMRHRLTMDDVAFWEAMETEQAACIDSVLGYHLAPAYSECSD